MEKTMKRYYCRNTYRTTGCGGYYYKTEKEIINATTKREAKEIFKKQHNGLNAKICIEIPESEDELGFSEVWEKYDRY